MTNDLATTIATVPDGTGSGSPPADADLATMLLIRHFELALLDLFARGELHGTTHTCLGQEHVPVALAPLLGERDYVFSNHRGHGHYIARFGDPAGLLAEIMGREGAVCNGVGGSQHIFRDRYLSTGVQGESLPVAAGVALHLKRHEPGALALTYIGDGTWGEGAVYEALNMAALWRLPLLVVVEHNGIAQSTATDANMAGTIGARAAAFGIAHMRVESISPAEIRTVAGPLVDKVRHGAPLVLEFVTNRLGPHSKGDDTRTDAELRRVRAADWHAVYREAPGFAEADSLAAAQVAQLVDEVSARQPAVWSTA
ncbi:dehydrogenase [Lentzea sp. NBRC 105346]|uniref:thiamine pyrophosphate-dependent dehydrogenase E1 component subunit alpha n=1 Tax=Lentzea sp. NBRC 105346 TaxID=3032205 RepID=UPI0024A0C6F2|nr:thiamine pyrophosphate-dependent dehydrogenase E1 component subunit alpha [Lentzea sp. NBRC 105346]GLZ31995.1 dehydrogenase [Lentzea sp. NBRC 105346]